MNAGKQVNLRVKRAHIVDSASVNTLVFIKQPAADNKFLKLIKTFVKLLGLFGIYFIEFFVNLFVYGLEPFIADSLVVGIESGLDVVNGEVLDSLEHIGGNLLRFKRNLLLADFLLNHLDEFNNFLIDLVGIHNAVIHCFVVNLVCAGLDHCNKVCGGSNGNGHIGLCSFLLGGIDDKLALNKTHRNAADGAVPRNLGNGDCN